MSRSSSSSEFSWLNNSKHLPDVKSYNLEPGLEKSEYRKTTEPTSSSTGEIRTLFFLKNKLITTTNLLEEFKTKAQKSIYTLRSELSKTQKLLQTEKSFTKETNSKNNTNFNDSIKQLKVTRKQLRTLQEAKHELETKYDLVKQKHDHHMFSYKSAENEIKYLREVGGDTRNRVTELEEKNDVLKTELEGVKNELKQEKNGKHGSNETDSTLKELSAIKLELEKVSHNRDEISKQLNLRNRELNETKHNHQEKDRKNVKLQSQLNGTKAKLTSLEKSSKTEINGLSQQIHNTDNLRAMNHQLTLEKEELLVEICNFEERFSKNEEETVGYKNQLEDITSLLNFSLLERLEIDESENSANFIEKRINSLLKQVQTGKTKEVSDKGEIEDLRIQLDAVVQKSELDTAMLKSGMAKQQKTKIEELKTESETIINKLVKNHNAEIGNLKTKLISQSSENEDLKKIFKKQKSALQNSLKLVSTEKFNLETELTETTKKLMKISSESAPAKLKIPELEEEVAKTNRELNVLVQQNQLISDKLREKIKSFEELNSEYRRVCNDCDLLKNENQRVKVSAGRLGEEDGQRKLEMTRVKLEMGEIYAQNVRKNEEIQGLKDKVFGLETEKGDYTSQMQSLSTRLSKFEEYRSSYETLKQTTAQKQRDLLSIIEKQKLEISETKKLTENQRNQKVYIENSKNNELEMCNNKLTEAENKIQEYETVINKLIKKIEDFEDKLLKKCEENVVLKEQIEFHVSENRGLIEQQNSLESKLTSRNVLLKKEKGRVFREKNEGSSISQLKKRVSELQDECVKNKKFSDTQVVRLKAENEALKVSLSGSRKDLDGKSVLVDRYKSKLEISCGKFEKQERENAVRRSENEVLEEKIRELEVDLEVKTRLFESSGDKVSERNLQIVKLLGAIDSGPSKNNADSGDFTKKPDLSYGDLETSINNLDLTDIELQSLVPRLKLLAKMAGDNFSLNNSVLDKTSFENTVLDDSRITLGENTLDLLGITPIAKNPKRRSLTSNTLETIESQNNESRNSSTPNCPTLFEALIS